MDHRQALHAHVTWYADLSDRIAKGDEIDPAGVMRDDTCDLGKWLYGEASPFSGLPEYEAFEEAHAKFHACAAEAVGIANAGNREEALRRLQVDGKCMGLSDSILEQQYLLLQRIKKEGGGV